MGMSSSESSVRSMNVAITYCKIGFLFLSNYTTDFQMFQNFFLLLFFCTRNDLC
jgi:hypothetical protein